MAVLNVKFSKIFCGFTWLWRLLNFGQSILKQDAEDSDYTIDIYTTF